MIIVHEYCHSCENMWKRKKYFSKIFVPLDIFCHVPFLYLWSGSFRYLWPRLSEYLWSCSSSNPLRCHVPPDLFGHVPLDILGWPIPVIEISGHISQQYLGKLWFLQNYDWTRISEIRLALDFFENIGLDLYHKETEIKL